MSIFTDVVNGILVNSMFLFLSFFVLLASSAYIGKFVFKKRSSSSKYNDSKELMNFASSLSKMR